MNKNIVISVLVLVVILIGGIFLFSKNGVTPADDQSTTTTTTTTSSVSSVASAPTVVTSTNVIPSNSTAAVTGQVTPNGAATSYWYEYGETSAFGTRTTVQALGSGFSAISTPGFISGLRANTQYYFRLNAQNSFATVNGATYSFTTNNNPAPVGVVPTVRTNAATDVSRTTANLAGQVNPNGYSTTYWFEYGESSNLGNVTKIQVGENGSALIPVSAILSNLKPLTKYYFRLNAQNQYGTVNGSVTTFTTKGPSAPGVPAVTTDTPANIATSSATFRGEVNPNGVATSYWFEYSEDSLLGSIIGTVTPAQPLAGDTLTVSVKLDVTTLGRDIKYFYRLVAKNDYGTVNGNIVSFRTKK